MKFLIFTPEVEQTNKSFTLKRISERNNLSCRVGQFWNQKEGGGPYMNTQEWILVMQWQEG